MRDQKRRGSARDVGPTNYENQRIESDSTRLSQALLPVPRLPPIVRYGENSDVGRRFEVDHVVRKPRHGTTADCQIRWHSRNQGARSWHGQDLIDGGVNSVEELDAQVLPPLLVPAAGKAVFRIGLVLESNAWIHRRRSSASARRRTSSHGIPVVSPASTRRARRSISAAHAASTSAGCSACASSRLAKSWAATSARSFKGNASASRKSSCARDDMPPFYTPKRQPTRDGADR